MKDGYHSPRHPIPYQAERTGKRWYHFWSCNFIWKAKGFLELPFNFRNLQLTSQRLKFTPLLARLGKQNTWEYLVFPSHRQASEREVGDECWSKLQGLPQWKPGNTKIFKNASLNIMYYINPGELLQTVVLKKYFVPCKIIQWYAKLSIKCYELKVNIQNNRWENIKVVGVT